MASLHRRPNSPYWWASYKDGAGIWRLRSTKETVRSAAEKVLQKIDDAARLAGRGELTRVAAIKILGEMVESSTGERLNDPIVRTFFANWLSGKGETRSSGTVARYRPAVDGFIASLGPRAEKSLRGVTTSDLESFRKVQVEAGKSNGSANLDVKIIKIGLDAARKQGILSFNPADALEALPNDEHERQPFTKEQVCKLLDAADDEWRGMILLGVLTGLRLADAASLTWANIDLQSKSLAFRPQKTRRTGKTLTVALHVQVADWIETLPASDNPDAPLIPSLYGKGTGSHGGLSNAFHRIMEKAGVLPAQTRKGKGKGRGFSPLSFHSLRHTFVSALTNADVAKDVRKAVAGHTCDRAHERYTHLALDTQRRALAGLPSYGA